MPLIMRNIPEPKPDVLFEFWWTSGGLSELDGVGIIKGERYLLKLGRKVGPHYRRRLHHA